MKKVLVTGAGGQLGKSIQKIAPHYPKLELHYFQFGDLDITDSENVISTFSEKDYDYCINCAAYTAVDDAEKFPEPAFAVNAEGAKNLALACRQNGIKLIQISTDYVFDGQKKEGYKPTDAPNPINVYGKSKLLGEQYIQSEIKEYFIVRTSWLYSEFGHNFYKTILEKARQGKALEVTDQQLGCPTHAQNLARYLLELIQWGSEEYGIYHFTDGVPMSWYSFAKRILRENGLENSVSLKKAKNYRTFAARPAYSILRSTNQNS